jgi:hypothetical protein
MATTNETPNLDRLRREVDILKRLLDDPHPGLITWNMAYARQMEKLVAFWTEEEVKDR